MQRISLDTTRVTSVEELHAVLKRDLGLPDHYGNNLDALWDCLTAWVDLPLTVEWRGFADLHQSIGGYADQVLQTFRQAETELESLHVELVS